MISGQIGSVLDFAVEDLAGQILVREQSLYNKITPLHLMLTIKKSAESISAIAANSNKVWSFAIYIIMRIIIILYSFITDERLGGYRDCYLPRYQAKSINNRGIHQVGSGFFLSWSRWPL